MRVLVRTLRLRGRNLTRDDLQTGPRHEGYLSVVEKRDIELGRPVVLARLVDSKSGIETDVLPELSDARLLWVESGKMRLTGLERIDKADYAQTWALEVV